MKDVIVHGVSNWKLYFEGDYIFILDKIYKEKIIRTCERFIIKLNTPVYNIGLSKTIQSGCKLKKIERSFNAFNIDDNHDKIILPEVILHETYDNANLDFIITKHSKEESIEKITIIGNFKEYKNEM